MRKSFDQGVPLEEQHQRIVKAKTGRKHQHRIGPGRKKPKGRAALEKKLKVHASRSRAFWSGDWLKDERTT